MKNNIIKIKYKLCEDKSSIKSINLKTKKYTIKYNISKYGGSKLISFLMELTRLYKDGYTNIKIKNLRMFTELLCTPEVLKSSNYYGVFFNPIALYMLELEEINPALVIKITAYLKPRSYIIYDPSDLIIYSMIKNPYIYIYIYDPR